MSFKIYNYFKKLLKKEPNIQFINHLEEVSDQSAVNNSTYDDNNELALVSNVLGLKDLTAADIMIPRADIVAASIDTPLEKFIDIFSQHHFSQIPIYKNTLDDIVGIVRVRDFLPYINNPQSFNINSLLKDVIYVVPSIKLLELLVEIRASVNHMALIVDEFGGIDGLVTLQDVVSEIVGEIQQTHGIFPQISTRQDGSFIADAKMPIEECSNTIGVDLIAPFISEGEDLEIETLGGLAMLLAERIPTRGETLTHPSGIEFEIADADPRHVKRIIIRKNENKVL